MDFKDLRELYDRRTEIARREREEKGRPVIGTLCSYVPVELLHSFGILPLRIWGHAEDVDASGRLLQPYVCPPVRHLMAMGLEGSYSFLDGIVHCYTCDATCGLYNIWERNLGPALSHMVSLPYMSIPESLQYALAEFETLVEKLESFTGSEFSAGELERSSKLYTQARSFIGEAYRLKAEGIPLSYADIQRMNLCLQALPVETTITLLEGCLEEARSVEPVKSGGPRILLSGSVITDTGLVDFIESSGCAIVADDTCMGYRIVEDARAAREGLSGTTVPGEGDSASGEYSGDHLTGTSAGRGPSNVPAANTDASGARSPAGSASGITLPDKGSARDSPSNGGLPGAPPHGADPLESLARYYLESTPCASRADFPTRKAYLLRAVGHTGADAVIFVHQKFCDPHLADFPFLKEVLTEAGVPSMQVEIEGESFNSQVRTRVEGFFEMIGAG